MARIKLAADFKDFLSLCLSHEVRFLVIGGYPVVALLATSLLARFMNPELNPELAPLQSTS